MMFMLGFIHRHDQPTYTAKSRLVMGPVDPESAAESQVIADTARAIVTNPGLVSQALFDADLNRDPEDFALENIDLAPLGTSAVLELSVSEQDPQKAAVLANSLAAQLIHERQSITQTRLDQVFAEMNARIDELTTDLARIRSEINSSTETGSSTSSLLAERDDLVQRRAVLEAQREQLILADVSPTRAAIVSRATPPTEADPSRLLPDLPLGLLLGLILGVGIAALIESFRPTVLGRQAVARAANAPVLGELRGRPEEAGAFDLTGISTRLALAASTKNVDTVALLNVGGAADLTSLAAAVEHAVGAATAADSGADSLEGEPGSPQNGNRGAGSLSLKPVGETLRVVAQGNGHGIHSVSVSADSARTGLVLVTPRAFKEADLDAVTHLREVTQWHILGVVTYRQHGFKAGKRKQLSVG